MKIETKNLTKQQIQDIVNYSREITVDEINKGEFVSITTNGTPWDGPFLIELDNEKFYLLGAGHKFHDPEGAGSTDPQRPFVTGDASGRFNLNPLLNLATGYNLK